MFNLRFIAFALTFLASVGFLNPKGMLSEQMVKLMFYASSMMALAVAFLYGKSTRGINYPRFPYWGMLASIVFSIFMATAFHPQSLKVSAISTLGIIFAYLFFWTLLRLQVDEKQILKFLLICCFVAVPVYFADVATFPNYLFGAPFDKVEDMTRGMLRVPVFFLELMVMFLFYSINQWVVNRNKKWIIPGALFAVMIFLSVIRQVILISGVLSLIFLLKSSTWVKRGIVIAGVGIIYFVVLPKIPAYQAMVELTEDQSEANEVMDEDIRIYDYRYFGDIFQTNDVTRVFGNGIPSFGNSAWGNSLDSEWETTGTLPVDVGWVGFYWYYGAIAAACLLILLIKAAYKKKSPQRRYLTYTVIYYILAAIASGPILYSHQVLYLMIILYLIYGTESDQLSENGVNHPKLQQRRRLGELRGEC